MSYIFISHSSSDVKFASQLHDDLTELEHDVWLDEKRINVGDPISEKIQSGITKADFVIVVLSKASVASNWVAREWQAKFNDELQSPYAIILPVLIENCDVPPLLRDKQYADCRRSYGVGLTKLVRALEQFTRVELSTADVIAQQPGNSIKTKLEELLILLGDRNKALATTIPQVLTVAKELKDAALAKYCQIQLTGLTNHEYSIDNLPVWASSRIVKTYVCANGFLNLNHIGWGGNTTAIWQYIENSNDFKWFRVVIPDPIHWIETQAQRAKPNTLLTGSIPISDLVKSPKNPDETLHTYMRWNAYVDVCTRIRQDLVGMLAPYV